MALASLSSGKLLNAGGWETVNWVVFPAVAVALVMVALQARGRARRRRPDTHSLNPKAG